MLAATTIVFGLAHSEWLLVTARFAQGVSSSLTWAASLTWVTVAAPAERRGEMIGSVMGTAIGGALFGPVIGGIASVAGPGPAFGGVAVFAAAIAVAVAGTPSPPRNPVVQPLSALWRALRDPRLLTAMWFVVLPGLLFGTLGVLGPLRLSELGLGAVGIGATWLVATALEGVAAPLIGRFSDRRGRMAPLRAGLIGSMIAGVVLPWPDRWYVLVVVIVASVLAFGTFWAPGMSALADACEARGLDYAYGFALMNMAWAPGQLGGAAGGGAVADVTRDAVPYLCISGVCALTLALLGRRRSLLAPTPEWRSESSS
jgi:MFS family permease